MLLPISDADLAAYKARKVAQWERVASAIPGLQMIQSGDRGTSFTIGWSSGDDFEGVIFGQLPHVHLVLTGSPRNPVRRDAANDAKPIEKRAIDLTDEQIDAVIDAWRRGWSALTLPFVVHP